MEPKNKLPEEVAKKYACSIVPGVIITRPHPKTGKRKTVDLTKITLDQANELVETFKVSALVPVKAEAKAAKESK